MTASKQLLLHAGMLLFFCFTLLLAQPVAAQTLNADTTGLNATAAASGYQDSGTSLPQLVGILIDILVGISGVLVFLLFVYGGVIWMTAQGDPAKVGKAQSILSAAVIGLLIVLSAYAITNFVVTELSIATSGPALGPTNIEEIEFSE